jgi:hypothetical protein
MVFLSVDHSRHPAGVWVGKPLPPGNVTPRLIVPEGAGSLGAAWFLAPDGSLWNWGKWRLGWNNSLGIGAIPQRFGSDTHWVKVAEAGFAVLGLKDDGTLWSWGWNQQLGPGTALNLAPTRIGAETNWVQMAAGWDHGLALKNDGSLWAWGLNDHGQLGDGTTNHRPNPVLVGTDKDWEAIAANSIASFALRTNGTLWAWGQIAGKIELAPRQLNADTNCVAIAACTDELLVLKSDGTLWRRPRIWSSSQAHLTQIGTGRDWKQIDTGPGGHSARKQDGSWWVCGLASDAPQPVPYGFDPWGLGLGDQTTVVLTKDGALWSWGNRLGSEPSLARIKIQDILARIERRWPSLGHFFPPKIGVFELEVDKTPHRLWELPAEVRRSLAKEELLAGAAST